MKIFAPPDMCWKIRSEFSLESANLTMVVGALQASHKYGMLKKMLKFHSRTSMFSQCFSTQGSSFMSLEQNVLRAMMSIARLIGRTDLEH